MILVSNEAENSICHILMFVLQIRKINSKNIKKLYKIRQDLGDQSIV